MQIKTADNRILQEQLQDKVKENATLYFSNLKHNFLGPYSIVDKILLWMLCFIFS